MEPEEADMGQPSGTLESIYQTVKPADQLPHLISFLLRTLNSSLVPQCLVGKKLHNFGPQALIAFLLPL